MPERALKVVRDNEPDDLPEPPGHLHPEDADVWRRVTEEFVFGTEGLVLLEAALTARGRARQAREDIEENGIAFVNQDTGVEHVRPAVRIEKDALREFRLAWNALKLDVQPPEAS